MKKIYIIFLILITFSGFAQVKTNYSVRQNEATNLTPFFDASSSLVWNSSTNNGKGFVFPRTDLTTLKTITGPGRPGDENAPTRYDGMIVYNTTDGTPAIGAAKTPKVTRGFYYYQNDSNDFQGGHWVRIGSGDANLVSAGDYRTTEVDTGSKFYTASGQAKTIYRKMVDLTFGNGAPNSGSAYTKLPPNTFTANDIFVNSYLVKEDDSEVVGSVKIVLNEEISGDRGDFVVCKYGLMTSSLFGKYRLISEYYKKN